MIRDKLTNQRHLFPVIPFRFYGISSTAVKLPHVRRHLTILSSSSLTILADSRGTGPELNPKIMGLT